MNMPSTILRSAFVLLFGMGASGCLEHTIKTTVHEDGSFTREIGITTNSREVPQTPFPLLTGPGWDTTWSAGAEGKGQYVFTARRTFPSSAELQELLDGARDSSRINLTIHVDRSFRWFTTRYTYEETYARFTHYRFVAPEEVLTADEINRYTYGSRNDTINNKVDEWVARNLYEVFFRSLVTGAEQTGDPALTREALAQGKEQFFRRLVGYAGAGEKLGDPEKILQSVLPARRSGEPVTKGDKLTGAGMDALVLLGDSVFHTESFGKLRSSIEPAWNALEELIEQEGKGGDSFKQSVSLPGVFVDTNASDVVGSEATWSFDRGSLMLQDYTMRASSRVINVWAIWVSGISILLLLAALIVPGLLRKRPV